MASTVSPTQCNQKGEKQICLLHIAFWSICFGHAIWSYLEFLQMTLIIAANWCYNGPKEGRKHCIKHLHCDKPRCYLDSHRHSINSVTGCTIKNTMLAALSSSKVICTLMCHHFPSALYTGLASQSPCERIATSPT